MSLLNTVGTITTINGSLKTNPDLTQGAIGQEVGKYLREAGLAFVELKRWCDTFNDGDGPAYYETTSTCDHIGLAKLLAIHELAGVDELVENHAPLSEYADEYEPSAVDIDTHPSFTQKYLIKDYPNGGIITPKIQSELDAFLELINSEKFQLEMQAKELRECNLFAGYPVDGESFRIDYSRTHSFWNGNKLDQEFKPRSVVYFDGMRHYLVPNPDYSEERTIGYSKLFCALTSAPNFLYEAVFGTDVLVTITDTGRLFNSSYHIY